MAIEWDVPIEMDDGIVLRADVYRPLASGRYPVIMTYGPYGKGLSFQEGYQTAWELMAARYPDALEGSSNLYQAWEVADPEKWVPDGYVVVRVDSRGAGRSPGVIDHFSQRETLDYYQCIEWAGVQPWSNGKVGLNGISYYGANQWLVAAMQPPHLAAICPWEGFSDGYRESTFHGGILCTFGKNWQEIQVKSVQHGRGEGAPRSRVTGKRVCGDETLGEAQLKANRAEISGRATDHRFDDDFYAQRRARLDQVTVPVLSAANWGGQGLHLRGNVEGFVQAGSRQKWLELHGGEHWTLFYARYGVNLQKQFFGHYLKGEDNGWGQRPPVLLNVRHVDKFVERAESEWPLARTQWTRMHLDLARRALAGEAGQAPATAAFDAMGEGMRFMSAPFERETEITGPLACKLFVSSSTNDADIFLVLGLYDPQGREVVFQGALDPHTPVAQGWLRASHRELDPARSAPWRPFHAHQRQQPLEPGKPVELDVEIWPTSIVVPAGWTIGLTVRGKDYEYEGAAARLSNVKFPMKGCGPFLHDDPDDRPPSVFGGRTTLHSDAQRLPYLLVPVIPPR
ncbi:CocE/NonD family hydrolase [Verticiella sediminum]|uniref:CocE/NonD family hydrolase n=2 Tax=Verticiella sediminum TaxID=1247510 RepID=A0A556AEE2_9BURK|nr:CocE/NonD family hydrolase [Verticiella sediminum]